MNPGELRLDNFSRYPRLARQLAVSHITLLQQLPLALLAMLLREIIAYDWKFPMEQKGLETQLRYLDTLSQEALGERLAGFARLQLSSKLQEQDWVNAPVHFVEGLTAELWATRQIDSFREAAEDYVARERAAIPEESPATSRLAMVMIGQGVEGQHPRLFQKLRPQGVYFTQLNPTNGFEVLARAAADRAKTYPGAYAHWYIEGGQAAFTREGVTSVSYAALEPVRKRLLEKMEAAMHSGNAGPEAVRTMLAALSPEDLGMDAAGADAAALNHFKLSLLTEGSGTQIFSTTFVQWSAREVLRRAQPLTILVRFAPRVRERPMDDLLAGTHRAPALDAEGSLVDGDMGAYYTWLNLQRLPGADRASFLVWFEGRNEAVAIAPSLPRGAQSNANADLAQVLTWMS
ncbi:MAG TPA: hypothetical protein VEK33_20350 [Terriglobales bacterium]|nr:hypothetical protein [Terriglobales bacterium]